MATGIQVHGLSEFRRAIKQADESSGPEMAKIHKRVGGIVVAWAVAHAPSGPHQGSGVIVPIASSIKAAAQQSKVVVSAGGSRSPHALPYEFGGTIARMGSKGVTGRQHRRRHGGARGRTHIKQRAYLYPALEATRQIVIDSYLGALETLVRMMAD